MRALTGVVRPLSGVRLRADMAATDLSAQREHVLEHLKDPEVLGERMARVDEINHAVWAAAAQCASARDLIRKYEEDYQ